MKHDLEISEFVEATDTAQDPVESGSSSSASGNESTGDSSEVSEEGATFNAEELMSGTDVILFLEETLKAAILIAEVPAAALMTQIM